MGTITLYGIPNCDTVKKARAWLHARDDPHARDAHFHDFRKLGVPADRLDAWIDALGWERLLNRNGTTWRKLDESVRAAIVDARSAQALMLAQASVIKRPVVEWGDGSVTVGFSAADWAGR
ncbi:MAG: ArsC family reductase [Rhizobacter sp.]|nr:ArsC family reductase [Rhizobacter sp.]